jgi:hypothetical protein
MFLLPIVGEVKMDGKTDSKGVWKACLLLYDTKVCFQNSDMCAYYVPPNQ